VKIGIAFIDTIPQSLFFDRMITSLFPVHVLPCLMLCSRRTAPGKSTRRITICLQIRKKSKRKRNMAQAEKGNTILMMLFVIVLSALAALTAAQVVWKFQMLAHTVYAGLCTAFNRKLRVNITDYSVIYTIFG
jgi:hypothetical protein